MRITRGTLAGLLVGGAFVGVGASAASAGTDPCAHATIVGTDKNDVLRGTPGPDIIDGGAGDDKLFGLGGDDVLCGGTGQDVLRGGAGDDALFGGRDAKVAEDSDYYVYYGDLLDGGPGDDRLDPGVDHRHHDLVDTVTFVRSDAPVTLDMAAGTATGDGTDTLTGAFGTAHGSTYADLLVGSDHDETIEGDRGEDRIEGRGGDDILAGDDWDAAKHERVPNVIRGGADDDYLVGARGDDVLRGGTGSDLLDADRGVDRAYGGRGSDSFSDSVEAAAGQILDGGRGADSLNSLDIYDSDGHYQSHNTGRIDLEAGSLESTYPDGSVVKVSIPRHENALTPRGDLWTVRGTDGPNEIIAGFFGDRVHIRALGGRDRIFGSKKNDLLDGGPGHDVGSGFTGHDRIISVEKIYH